MSSFTHVLYHFFLERIMSDALEEHDGKVSIRRRTVPICGLPMTLMLLLKSKT